MEGLDRWFRGGEYERERYIGEGGCEEIILCLSLTLKKPGFIVPKMQLNY